MSIIFHPSFAFHHENNTLKMHFCYPTPFPSPRVCQDALWTNSCTSIWSSCCCNKNMFSFPWFHFIWWRLATCHLMGSVRLISLFPVDWDPIISIFSDLFVLLNKLGSFLVITKFQRPFFNFYSLYNTQCLNRRVLRPIYLFKVKVTSNLGQSFTGGVLKKRLWTIGLGSMHPQSRRVHSGR